MSRIEVARVGSKSASAPAEAVQHHPSVVRPPNAAPARALGSEALWAE